MAFIRNEETRERPKTITLKGAKPIFGTNFSGDARDKYDVQGRRYVTLVLEGENLKTIETFGGFNIKTFVPKHAEEGEEVRYLKVNINYSPGRVPSIFLLPKSGGKPSGKKTLLDADSVKQLDSMDIEEISCTISPYSHEGDGRYTAYLSTAYVVTKMSELEELYSDWE